MNSIKKFNYKVNEVRANMLSLTLEEMEDYYNQLDYNGCLFNSEHSNYYRNLKKEVLAAFANANSSYVTFQNETFGHFRYVEGHSTSQRLNKKESHMLKESFRDNSSIELNNVTIDSQLMETIERIKTRKIHKKELDPAKYSKLNLKKVRISIYTNFLFKLL